MSLAKRSANHSGAEVYAHKLFAPTSLPGAILRPRLLDQIVADDAPQVTVLQGPAGHGKTTLAQQIKAELETRGYTCAWLSLDEADNDVRRFSVHMQALMTSMGPASGDLAIHEDTGPNSGLRRRSDGVLQRLALSGKPVALFFDDAQVLTNRSILEFFRELFERIPPHVRVLVGSRSLPEIGLARLLIHKRALVLRAEDLRFSAEEAERFFSAHGSEQVSAEEVDAIYRRTEGWPAALQLFRLTLASPLGRRPLSHFSEHRPRELAEYLVENVLGLQPADVQEFLRRTSLLTRLSAPLCNAVTGREDSQELLLRLERSGLFLRCLDAHAQWFEYHGLFSFCLSEHLRSNAPAVLGEVHRKAAPWYLSHGHYEEAVHHFLGAQDLERAADTMDIWASTLTASGQLMTVERWCDRLPLEVIAGRPALAIKLIYALVFLRRQHKAAPLLQILRGRRGSGSFRDTTRPDVALANAAVCADDISGAFDIVDGLEMRQQLPEGFAAFEFGAAANILSFRASMRGAFDEAREHLALARAYNSRGEASFSGGYTAALAGLNLVLQGDLVEALVAFRRGMQDQRQSLEGSFASAVLVSCHVWALYEANDLDAVEALFAQYHDLISDAVLLDFLALAYLSMARTQDARGRPLRALEVLEEAESLAHANGWQRLLRLVQWERIRRLLLSGAIERARAVSEYAGRGPRNWPADATPLSEDAEGESLGRIRLHIHSLELDEAGKLIAQEMSLQRNRRYREMKLHLLEALRHEKTGARNAAQRSLRRALQIGRPGRFVRCFLDEGDDLLRLLREAYQTVIEGIAESDGTEDPDRGYLELLLQASGTDLSRFASRRLQPLEPLTEREKQILLFLANGASNKEVASRVFVSENTVKFHLKNIYSKLCVGSRVQAISAARQLGLIA